MKVKEIVRLLKQAKNPVIIKQLENDFKSWSTIKRLVDQKDD